MHSVYAFDGLGFWQCPSTLSDRVIVLLGSCSMLANWCVIWLSVAPGSSSTSEHHMLFPLGEPIVAAYRANRLTCSWFLLLPPPVLRTVLLPPSETHCPAWLSAHGIHSSSLCISYILSPFPVSLLSLDCHSCVCGVPFFCSRFPLLAHHCGTVALMPPIDQCLLPPCILVGI